MERRIRNRLSFAERCSQEAERLRAEAEKLPEGPERKALTKRARQANTAAHIDEWLRSSGLRPPK